MIVTNHPDGDDGLRLDAPITARRVHAGSIVRTCGLGQTIVTAPAWVIDVDCGARAEQILVSERALRALFDGLDLSDADGEFTVIDAELRVRRR